MTSSNAANTEKQRIILTMQFCSDTCSMYRGSNIFRTGLLNYVSGLSIVNIKSLQTYLLKTPCIPGKGEHVSEN